MALSGFAAGAGTDALQEFLAQMVMRQRMEQQAAQQAEQMEMERARFAETMREMRGVAALPVVVLLGRPSGAISQLGVSEARSMDMGGTPSVVLSTYHPAAALRSLESGDERQAATIIRDLRRAKRYAQMLRRPPHA